MNQGKNQAVKTKSDLSVLGDALSIIAKWYLRLMVGIAKFFYKVGLGLWNWFGNLDKPKKKKRKRVVKKK